MTDSPGSDSADGSMATSNTTSTAASPMQTAFPTVTVGQGKEPEWHIMQPRTNDDDEASDISMSADSSDSDDEPTGITIVSQTVNSHQPTSQDEDDELSRKRKHLSQDDREAPNFIHSSKFKQYKRVKYDQDLQSYWTEEGKLQADRSILPAEIWHYILAFTPPKALGRLLHVNKIFNTYLDPSFSAIKPILGSLARSVVPTRQPGAIWQSSRRLYHPGMPSPLEGLTEIAMWKLSCNLKCQFCDRKDNGLSLITADPWRSGPGEIGVRPIWQFGIRSCGSCLKERCVKEIDLLLSSSVPSPLMAALPFIFLTDEVNVISATTLQQGPPPSIQITKHFYKPHIEDIKLEFFKVKAMGSGTAEEWLKGLESRGKDKRNDASRWEKWELIGGLQRVREKETIQCQASNNKPKKSSPKVTQAATSQIFHESTTRNGLGTHSEINNLNAFTPHAAQPIVAPFVINSAPRFDSSSQNAFGPYASRPFQGARPERSKEEVIEMKAARKGEIERRCSLLDPPLVPGVLAHMGSFQAAIQIIKPFDDNAWDLLLPRLRSQREEAEQREADRLAHTRVIQEKFDERRQQDAQLKEAKDIVDREWEDVQTPLRTRIAGYADEIIREGWNDGEKITHDSSPRFAAEVLIYVRKRFYAEISKDDAASRAAGQQPQTDPANGPFLRKLILENMKWVYDMKIKPHTEQYRKELFLCSVCENNFKFYGFEGVIQHYAAKHTNALSVGSIVVHWRAEWPEQPPFNPDPVVGKGSFQSNPVSLSSAYPPTTVPLLQGHGLGGYSPVSGTAPVPVSAPLGPGYQTNPGSYYSTPTQFDQFPGQQTGPAPGFQVPQYATAGGYAQYQGQGYASQGFETSYTGAHPLSYDPAYPGQTSPVPLSDGIGSQYTNVPPPSQSYSQDLFQPGGISNAGLPTAGIYRSEEYKAKLLDVARIARDIWNSTTGVKDMPGSVRVFVILFHVLKGFREKYSDDPPLSMLIDGLSNNKDMRPVRNVNGLACRACLLEKAARGHNPYPRLSKAALAAEKKLFSFPQLLNHFQATHIAGAEGLNVHDWTTDMVELADKKKISAFIRNSAVDEFKMQLVLEALPKSFTASPLVSDQSTEALFQHGETAGQAHTYRELAPSQDNHESYYTSDVRNVIPSTGRIPDQYNPNDQAVDVYGRLLPSRNKKDESRSGYPDNSISGYVEQRDSSLVTRRQPPDGYRRVNTQENDLRYEENLVRYQDVEQDEPHQQSSRGPESMPHANRVPSLTDRVHTKPQKPSPVRIVEMNEPQGSNSLPTRGSNYYVEHQDNGPSRRLGIPPPSLGTSTNLSQLEQHIQSGLDGPSSEEGEIRGHFVSRPNKRLAISTPTQTENAAERFLNDFLAGESPESYAKKAEEAARREEEALREMWASERQRMYQPPMDAKSRDDMLRQDEETRNTRETQRRISTSKDQSRFDRVPPSHRQVFAYEYDDRYATAAPEYQSARIHASGLAESQYEVSDLVYLDELQDGRSTQPMPTRNSRYEPFRKRVDDTRSRSPIYVNVGGVQPRYREQSPGPRYSQHESIYRTRTPQASIDEVTYERVSRPEYYRIYEDEPRQRQAHFDGQIQYVQVNDQQGDYVIRRPLRREPEPVYATYEDEGYSRPVVYETRVPVSRSDPAFYEEYDPRNPAPPPSTTTIRQIRYE